MIPAGSRTTEDVIYQDMGEEMHHCGFCGTRTSPDEGLHYATGAYKHDCPHCGQRYKLEDSSDLDDPVSLDGEGEIEIVDEHTGEVLGMTQDPEPTQPMRALDKLKERLNKMRAEKTAAPEPIEASLGDLEHLFGIPPSPYGEDFGRFG